MRSGDRPEFDGGLCHRLASSPFVSAAWGASPVASSATGAETRPAPIHMRHIFGESWTPLLG